MQPYESVQEAKKVIKKKDWTKSDKVFASGKRKTCSSLAILKPGSGKVTINREPFIRYFPCPMDRRHVLKAIEIAGFI